MDRQVKAATLLDEALDVRDCSRTTVLLSSGFGGGIEGDALSSLFVTSFKAGSRFNALILFISELEGFDVGLILSED